jgi:hypothetical protein
MIENGHLFGLPLPLPLSLMDRAHYPMRNGVAQAHVGCILIINIAKERTHLSQSLHPAAQLIAFPSVKQSLRGDLHLDAGRRRETRPGDVVNKSLADDQWRSAVGIFGGGGRL